MDTLTYFDKLIEGGVVPEQARVQAHTLNDVLGNINNRIDSLKDEIKNCATKADLKEVKDDVKTIKWSLLIGILLLCAKAAFHL